MKRLTILGIAIAGMVTAMPASAQELGINPVRIEMVGNTRAAIVTVRNTSDAPVNLQVRAMDWQQVDGKESFTPSDMLMASPPMAALAPGETQVVRLNVDGLPPGDVEKAFRLVLDQIPTVTPTEGTGMRIKLRVLLPVFVLPKGKASPDLHWAATRSDQGLILTATNNGTRHDRLIHMKVTVGTAAPIEVPSSNSAYILSSGSQSWTIVGVPAGAQSLHISSDGDFGAVNADVPITP